VFAAKKTNLTIIEPIQFEFPVVPVTFQTFYGPTKQNKKELFGSFKEL